MNHKNHSSDKGYKQTEVGVIPEDWKVKKLGDIADVATGNTPPTRDSSNYGEDFLFVSPADLGKGKYIKDTEKKLSKKGFDISRKFPTNSILFTCIGSTIGKAGISAKELTSNQQINAIFPDDSFSTDYVFYALNLLSPKIKSLAGEQAVPIINKSAFEETLLPLPPTKAEQNAIAAALSDADALITSLEKLIAKKRNIKQGAMQKCLNLDSYDLDDDHDFGEAKENHNNQTNHKNHSSDKWVVKRLGEIAPLQRGFDLPAAQLQTGKYPVVYSNGIENRHSEYKVKAQAL